MFGTPFLFLFFKKRKKVNMSRKRVIFFFCNLEVENGTFQFFGINYQKKIHSFHF